MVSVHSKWLEGSGPYADIAISSRVRLARNLSGYPFPSLLSGPGAAQIVESIGKVIRGPGVTKVAGSLHLVEMADLPLIDRQALVEKHLISPQLAATDSLHQAVALRDDEAVSIMINEEDHIRLQCLLPALQLHEAWRLATVIDDALEKELNFAFDETYGYLTACPTNVGTGLRASVMVHLPALVMSKRADPVLRALTQVGLTVRGLYGEGSQATGNLFQISNQVTLGVSEDEVLAHLSNVTKQIIDQERELRENIRRTQGERLEDQVGRAYGLLRYAHVMSTDEALSLLSQVRLGVDLKLMPELDPRQLNQLLILIQPAFLQKIMGREMSAQDRDIERARIIRQHLGGN